MAEEKPILAPDVTLGEPVGFAADRPTAPVDGALDRARHGPATRVHARAAARQPADGAAVAAAAAVYIVDLRTAGEQHNDLSVHARQLLTTVARRHNGVQTQPELDAWISLLGLDDVGRILVGLRNVVDVLVQDNWWIDRDAIHSQLPDQ